MLFIKKALERGNITTMDGLNKSSNKKDCQKMIKKWAMEVYHSWSRYHELVDSITNEFIKKHKGLLLTIPIAYGG